MRTHTKLVAKVLDLSRIKGVVERLAEEQRANPEVASLGHVRMALVDSRNGTFVVLHDGSYFRDTIDNGPTNILLRATTASGAKLANPIMGAFTAEELRSAVTGEEHLLEDFIDPGMPQDSRFIKFIAVNGLGATL